MKKIMLSAVILAAGAGRRLNAAIEKPLVKIGRKPVIIYSLESFSKHPDIDEIIVVVSAKNKQVITRVVEKYSFKKIKIFCLGGRRRQDSVYAGIRAVNPSCDWVLIHDCARPFVSTKSITKVISEAKRTQAAILGVPVKATIKSIKDVNIVDRTLDRSSLWEIQTPQVFKKELILKAYNRYIKEDFTDDASLVEKIGAKVKIVQGSYGNIKITTKEDFLFAEVIVKNKLL
ncbi:MAG: 2-C-methyl-D-erythritol 4-phosphate cytidylyltransferase [Candidatus Omnitrophota bacterium]|nr:2-C-methyl-D-erythritol 4-phosphate cytidylyltransferase [Candidatus Omnitrophota bacterium]